VCAAAGAVALMQTSFEPFQLFFGGDWVENHGYTFFHTQTLLISTVILNLKILLANKQRRLMKLLFDFISKK
jgi:hypothetical protein